MKKVNLNVIRNKLRKMSALFFDDVLEGSSSSTKYNLRGVSSRKITVPIPQSL